MISQLPTSAGSAAGRSIGPPLEPEPLVEKCHDCHHLLTDAFRVIVSHEFVAVSEHVVTATLIHELFRNNRQERREETALLSDCLVWTLTFGGGLHSGPADLRLAG
jgi:hypothetical protein